MTQLTYPFQLLPGTPENVNQLNANLEAIRNVINGGLDASNLATSVIQANTVLSSIPVRDVGEFGQIRAGRVLTIADFTNMGLSAPLGLWNLSNVNDFSGNSRTLSNKGVVGFGPGITGAGAEAAQFTGSTAQALYLSDTGVTDPFRIKTGSWGSWFRTAKRGVQQAMMAKWTTAAQFAWLFVVNAANQVQMTFSTTGSDAISVVGLTDVAEDRWHFAVATHDGTRTRIYVDGALEASMHFSGVPFAGSAPLNIGGAGADGTAAAAAPHFGRVDEAFITSDVLSDDQVRNLYLASIPHTLGAVPKTVRMRVTRRKRGGPFVPLDFPATPARLYNFTGTTATSLNDEGANATAVVNAGVAPVSVAGVDGTRDGAYSFGSGATTHFVSSDAGMPSGTTARSYGGWFKISVPPAAEVSLMGWGTPSTGDARLAVALSGLPTSYNGGTFIGGSVQSVADGIWHQIICVEDPAPIDGLFKKLYVDGRVTSSATSALGTITLAGAGRFRIGASAGGAAPFTGQADGVFVYGGTLTDVQVRALYNKGGQALTASPKSEGDHIESLEADRMLATFDTLDPASLIDMEVLT